MNSQRSRATEAGRIVTPAATGSGLDRRRNSRQACRSMTSVLLALSRCQLEHIQLATRDVRRQLECVDSRLRYDATTGRARQQLAPNQQCR